VSIGFGVTVGPGVRVRESIILGNSVLQNHSCILHSIVGWNSVIGSWVRIEGTPSDPDPNKAYAKIEHQNLFSRGKLNPSITIIGKNNFFNFLKYTFIHQHFFLREQCDHSVRAVGQGLNYLATQGTESELQKRDNFVERKAIIKVCCMDKGANNL
jgi:NDP-sugar pyrophosphorylase family protein